MAPSAQENNSRFLTPSDVAAELNVSQAQVYTLVRNRELRAITIGGRGHWRVERTDYPGMRPRAPLSGQAGTLMTRPHRPMLAPYAAATVEVAS